MVSVAASVARRPTKTKTASTNIEHEIPVHHPRGPKDNAGIGRHGLAVRKRVAQSSRAGTLPKEIATGSPVGFNTVLQNPSHLWKMADWPIDMPTHMVVFATRWWHDATAACTLAAEVFNAVPEP
mmetsp:Transcript_24504/g.50925  ORF Transcript_24504/g.50925 Transcript_24504/m.50925 type:complete len:125 (+) Transcript_24504:138-512(+)